MYRLMQLSQTTIPVAASFTHLFSSSRTHNRVEFVTDFPQGDDAEVISSLQVHPHGWCALSRNVSNGEKSEVHSDNYLFNNKQSFTFFFFFHLNKFISYLRLHSGRASTTSKSETNQTYLTCSNSSNRRMKVKAHPRRLHTSVTLPSKSLTIIIHNSPRAQESPQPSWSTVPTGRASSRRWRIRAQVARARSILATRSSRTVPRGPTIDAAPGPANCIGAAELVAPDRELLISESLSKLTIRRLTHLGKGITTKRKKRTKRITIMVWIDSICLDFVLFIR